MIFIFIRRILFVAVFIWGTASCGSVARDKGMKGEKGASGPPATAQLSRKAGAAPRPGTEGPGGGYTLEECLGIAMRTNESQPIARSALAVAEAQHRQALAAYWPQIQATAGASLAHHDLTYLQPAMNVPVSGLEVMVPDMKLTTPQTMVTLPANAFGPGFPPRAVQVPVASQNLTIPGRPLAVRETEITVPAQEVELMDRAGAGASLDMKWLLWDGGERKAQRGMALAGVDAAAADVRRSGLEVTRDVTRYYYGAVLARRLLKVAETALDRMTASLELTEILSQRGSGKVLRTDYLRNKILADSLAGMVRELEGNRDLADAALAFTMGLNWREKVVPASHELPVREAGGLDQYVGNAYQFSPDWKKLEAGLDAAAHALSMAKAGRLPKLALTGSLFARTTGQDGIGQATDPNLRGWNIGIGFELPVWDGFLTKNRIAEAKARLAVLAGRKGQLGRGLALQVKTGFIRLKSSSLQHASCLAAVQASVENRRLSELGYSADLIPPDKVFESQWLEALMEARALKCAFDHLTARADLDYTVGRSALASLAPAP
ncbi:MAG: outer rane efflux protein [Verrucomicrobiales bacterium]|nr:outer rane efflux protein [Verrucomicrobiales bacterium]